MTSRPYVTARRTLTLLWVLAGITACAAPIPSATPRPTATTEPTVTVCATGCDFAAIQAAIDADATSAGDVIYVADSVHTEAGVIVSKDVTIRGQGAPGTIGP